MAGWSRPLTDSSRSIPTPHAPSAVEPSARTASASSKYQPNSTAVASQRPAMASSLMATARARSLPIKTADVSTMPGATGHTRTDRTLRTRAFSRCPRVDGCREYAAPRRTSRASSCRSTHRVSWPGGRWPVPTSATARASCAAHRAGSGRPAPLPRSASSSVTRRRPRGGVGTAGIPGATSHANSSVN